MTRRFLLLAVAAALVCLAVNRKASLRAAAGRPQSLTSLVAARSLTSDTNGDGLADAVAARIIVPAAPTPQDVEVATNLAARLGYETTALSLPLVLRDEDVARESVGVPILVGRGNRFVRPLIGSKAIDVSTLKPGQGLIAAVTSPLGGGDGLVVVGGDDEGTLNAGLELAARLPRVWSMSGITLPGVEEQAIRYLRSHGVNVVDAAVGSMIVDSEKRGIARIDLRVAVAEGHGVRAAKLFDDLELAHRRGQEPRTLAFTNVATIAIEVVSNERVVGQAAVARTGLNQDRKSVV